MRENGLFNIIVMKQYIINYTDIMKEIIIILKISMCHEKIKTYIIKTMYTFFFY